MEDFAKRFKHELISDKHPPLSLAKAVQTIKRQKWASRYQQQGTKETKGDKVHDSSLNNRGEEVNADAAMQQASLMGNDEEEETVNVNSKALPGDLLAQLNSSLPSSKSNLTGPCIVSRGLSQLDSIQTV